MFRRFLSVVWLVLAMSLVLAGVVFAAEGATKQVGLVIAFPDGTRHTEVVTVPVGATTFEALQAAQIKLVSQTTSFGPAICAINNVGCPATNCFCNPKEFWAYYHLTGDTWTVAAEGAGSYVPADGAVEGLAWSGMDANFNPTTQPPLVTFAQILAAPELATLPQTGGVVWPLAGIAGGLALVLAGLATRQYRIKR